MDLLKKFLTFIAWGFVAIFAITIMAGFLAVVVLFARGVGEEDLGSYSVKTSAAVGVVDLHGEIISSDKFRASLKKFADDKKIKAVVIRIDSPGGSVGASEEMYRAIKETNEKKPVVCSLGNIAASGGLYASLGCRKVVTNEGTLTGSIGVILMIPNVSTLLNRFGLDMTIVKSGKFKDAGSPFHPLGEEERGLLQALVNQTYEQFVRAVAGARGLSVEAVKKFADGRVVLGEDAVKIGLADEIGGLSRAAKLALVAANINDEPEIVVPKPGGLPAWFVDNEESFLSWFKSRSSVRLLFQLDL